MLGLVSSRALGLFSNSTALNSFRDKLYPIAARALSHIPKPTHRQIRHATPLLFIGLFYLMQKLCYPIFLKIDLEYNRVNKLSDFIKSITAPIIKLSVLTVFTETIRRYLPINIQSKVTFVCGVSLMYATYKSQLKAFQIRQSQRREPERDPQAAHRLQEPVRSLTAFVVRHPQVQQNNLQAVLPGHPVRAQPKIPSVRNSDLLIEAIKIRKARDLDEYIFDFLSPLDILRYTVTSKANNDLTIRSFIVVSSNIERLQVVTFFRFIKIATDQKIPISIIHDAQLTEPSVRLGIILIKINNLFLVFIKKNHDNTTGFMLVDDMLTGWKGDAIRHTRFLPIESLVTSMKNGRNSIMRWDNIGFIYSILANKNPDFTIIREEMPRLESTSSSLVCGAGAASGVVGEPEISAEEITQLWKNIQIKLGILYRLMRSKNAIDPSFQGTENALSLAIKQKAPTYKASLKQQLESFLAQIEERTRTLSGKSGVRVAD